MQKKKIIYVGFAFNHHKNTAGGYHQVKEYLNYDKIVNAQWEKDFGEREFDFFLTNFLKRIYFRILGEGTPLTVIRCIIMSIFKKNLIFHFIYAENSYKWLHFFKGHTNSIVITLHQPFQYFENNDLWKKRIKGVDKLILVDNKDLKKFQLITNKANVFYIPHGINCEFFKPERDTFQVGKEQDIFRILLVGNWLRDFNLAAEVFRVINTKKVVRVDIITSLTNFSYFNDLNVNLHNNITNDELVTFYQNADVVFYPLLAFTANNALLEAVSCGCQVVVSAPRATESNYFSQDLVFYTDLVLEDAKNCLEAIMNNSIRKSSKDLLHDFVKRNYSWELIANDTKKIILS